MNPISDEDLVLYFYRDGLDPLRVAEIEDALFAHPALRARYEGLRRELSGAAEMAFAVESPDAGFEARTWQRVRSALPAEPARARWQRWRRALTGERPAARPAARLAARLAVAITVVFALGAGFLLGRRAPDDVPQIAATPAAAQPLLADDAGARVLAAYLAAHLEATERMLLVAANSPDEAATTRELAQSLVDSNRLYAAAAERAGRPQLAGFLRELEPVLIELANSAAGDSTLAIGADIRRRDLPFKARAAAALARSELDPSTRPL